jgi:signal peptidase I
VGTSEVQPVVYEEQIGDATYQVQYLHDKSMENGGPWQVPQDAVFVMGDNRDNSRDSRMFGTVPRDTVKGKVLKIYWSWDRETGTVRWERIGMMIH